MRFLMRESIIVDLFHGMLRFQPNACIIVLGRFHVFVVVLFFTETQRTEFHFRSSVRLSWIVMYAV